MTRLDAIATARDQAAQSGQRLAVYRFPAWREGVYGVRAVNELPREAETFESFGEEPASAEAEKRQGSGTEPAKKRQKMREEPLSMQGGLF